MPRAPLPPEARRLRRILYEDENSEAIRGLPLRPRITEPLFADLVVGCLQRNQERAERFMAHDRAIHARLLNAKGVQAIRKAADSWPFAASHAERAMAIDRERRRHHDEVAAWAKAEGRFFHPLICLYALFKYLVNGRIESYMQDNIPLILDLSKLHPSKKETWTAANISRTFRRRGGTEAANYVAFYLFSTDDRLKPYRPAPPPQHPQSGPPDPELVASLMGRALFRLPQSRKAVPIKPSRGGQAERGSV